MRVIYTSKGMSKKFGVQVIHQVRVIYRKIRYIARYTKTFSGLSIMAHLAQMEITSHSDTPLIVISVSNFYSCKFSKSCNSGQLSSNTISCFLFMNTIKSPKKFGTASHSYFPLSGVYNSTSKDSDTLHNEATNTQYTWEQNLRHEPNIVSIQPHSSIKLFISLNICQIQK